MLPYRMHLTRFLLLLFTSTNLIFPNIKIADIDVSNMDLKSATDTLQQNISIPKQISLKYDSEKYKLETVNIDLKYDYLASSQRALNLVNTGNFLSDLKTKFSLYKNVVNLGLISSYNQDKLNNFISIVEGQISKDPIPAKIEIVNSKIIITNGIDGNEINKEDLISKISKNISLAKSDEIEIKTKDTKSSLSETEIDNLKLRAEKLVGKKIEFKLGYNTYTKKDKDLIKFLDGRYEYNKSEIDKFVKEIADKENRNPQNPKFVFLPAEEGNDGRVSEFQPSLDGIKVDNEKLANLIIEAIKNNNEIVEIPVTRTPPEVTTDKINNLGIKELIGRGTSTYFHSIPGRVHNVALAVSKINGTLIAPGETFSFNKTLGDVSKFTGYQSAYVILSGKTVLGDGGGVCQVSSTLFRAVLNAGLPIDERASHAYRVGYYEQGSSPGFDATVYAPSPDFKFTNNTDNYILIEAVADSKNYSLVFELYGTKDGRISEVSKPTITNQSAPGPDVYQDDPTLPTGTIKQVEYRAYGAKVSFNYKVSKDGQEIYKKTFVSNYRPWQAVYLRGTGI